MELKSDIEFYSEAWGEINVKLKGTFFDTLWDAFRLCVSIGILYDSWISDQDHVDDKPTASIPRNMYNRNSEDMSYFFKTAILTSKRIDYSERDRLYLAFSEDIRVEDLEDNEEDVLKKGVSEQALSLNKIGFLKKFANYGADKIAKCISDNSSETMENIMQFLDDSYNCRTEELIAMKKVEDVIVDED